MLTAVPADRDELYRIGGGEFATVLRDTTADHDELGSTISIGVVIAHAAEPRAAMLARAAGRPGARARPVTP